MLSINNLDDQMFKEIVENAKKMIPNYTDEWLNQSSSDPGITFIELFAWLKEMQQYYLNQISAKNKYKYLKLLGQERIYDNYSTGIVTILNIENEKWIPDKCKFSANGIIFETTREEMLYPLYIKKFYTTQGEDVISTSERNWKEQYYVFGNELKLENKFYLCFNEKLPKNKNIDVTINIYNDYPIKRNEINDTLYYPLAKLKWEYYSENGWRKIKNIRDGTNNFINTGVISFSIDNDMKRDSNNFYLIRVILKECNYEVPPILKYISTNTIKVVQKDTLIDNILFSVSSLNIQQFRISNYLGQIGEIEVFIRRSDGLWEKTYEYDLNATYDNKVLIFDKSKHKKFPIEGKDNIRVCCYKSELNVKRKLGIADGFPFLSVNLNLEDIFYEDFEILISNDSNGMVWEEWSKTEDLYLSNCKDKSYFLDLSKNTLNFGDGINGRIPNGEIIIISCSTTIANEGNVKRGEINDILWNKNNEKILNYEHAVGGKKAPSIEDLFKQVRKGLKKVTRAVSDEDYEVIVKSTPGLMIKNAKAIVPEGQNSIFSNTNPNCIYIVAEAYSKCKKQELNKAYIRNIQNQIEKYRLITTEVEVIQVEYIGIDVYGEITVKSYYKDAKNRIEASIRDFFENEEWNFGQSLIYSNLYGRIDTLDCVSHIYSLSINFDGRGAKRNSSGDISIPENGMIYLKNYQIAVSDG